MGQVQKDKARQEELSKLKTSTVKEELQQKQKLKSCTWNKRMTQEEHSKQEQIRTQKEKDRQEELRRLTIERDVLKLEMEMHDLADDEKYEEAAALKTEIKKLQAQLYEGD